MAWVTITDPNVTGWEYSNDPNTDRKSQDTYDYDTNTRHVFGVVELKDSITKAVLARQTTHPHPGYGELMSDLTITTIPLLFQDDTDILFQDGGVMDEN